MRMEEGELEEKRKWQKKIRIKLREEKSYKEERRRESWRENRL